MIADPDYARAYTKIRCIAWSHGYAACLHGSFSRDLDVILVPWTEQVTDPLPIVRSIADVCDLRILDINPGEKPHGRKAWTLMFPGMGDPRWVDLSVMPASATPQSSPAHDIDAAAKTLAEGFDYPWDPMPEKGRENMRKIATRVLVAGRGKK